MRGTDLFKGLKVSTGSAMSNGRGSWKEKGKQEEKCKKQLEYIVVIQLFFAIAIDFRNAIFDRCRERTHIEGKTRDL